MQKFLISIVLFLILFLLGGKCRAEQIIMIVGETKSLPAAKSAWVENKNIIQIDDLGTSFLLKAKQTGSSEVRLGDRNLHVEVLEVEHDRARNALKPLIQKSINLKMSIENGTTVVSGRLLFAQEWIRLGEVCREARCRFLMKALMNPKIFKEVQQNVGQLLKSHSLPQFPVVQNKALQIHVPKQSVYFSEIDHLISQYGIQAIKDLESVDIAPLVKVQITLVEMKKSMMKKFGIEWPSSYQAQVLPTNTFGLNPVQFSAQFLEQNGIGKILASPNILCRSGKDAEFLAGGEFPIKIINFKIQDIIWKKYGIVLRVKPQADYSGRMSISLETEVSSIDDSRTVDGVPGMFTNRVQSHFDLTESRTIALSGLIKSENGKSAQGLPGMTQLPILGPLFSSQDFKENRTELVIFVHPYIMNPSTEENIQAPEVI